VNYRYVSLALLLMVGAAVAIIHFGISSWWIILAFWLAAVPVVFALADTKSTR
jgi:hypothetical protein